MKNVNMTVTGDILTITVDLSKEQGRSASGKTTVSYTHLTLPTTPYV